MVDIICYTAFGGHEIHGARPEVIRQFMVKSEVRKVQCNESPIVKTFSIQIAKVLKGIINLKLNLSLILNFSGKNQANF